MEATATARFARYSPRKVGQVLNLVRGKSVQNAFHLLPTVPRAASELVFKTVKSAYSNFGGADANQVYIKTAFANAGPVYKRIRPMAMGARAIYKRKTCHVTIVVTDEKPKKRKD